MFYTEKTISDIALNPAIGNGRIATIINSDTVYVAGLFNGYLDKTPSKKARIPSTHNITIVGENQIGKALSIKEGLYYQLS